MPQGMTPQPQIPMGAGPRGPISPQGMSPQMGAPPPGGAPPQPMGAPPQPMQNPQLAQQSVLANALRGAPQQGGIRPISQGMSRQF
jgi:hypothetical protein